MEVPLHTLIELTPQPDGKMSEQHISFDLKNQRHREVSSSTGKPSKVLTNYGHFKMELEQAGSDVSCVCQDFAVDSLLSMRVSPTSGTLRSRYGSTE